MIFMIKLTRQFFCDKKLAKPQTNTMLTRVLDGYVTCQISHDLHFGYNILFLLLEKFEAESRFRDYFWQFRSLTLLYSFYDFTIFIIICYIVI